MRAFNLHENMPFLDMASRIWDFALSHTPDEKEYFRAKSYKDKDSWEAFLWRMVPSIKYNQVWADPQELADNMAKNVMDHEKYHKVDMHLKGRA